jgi:hypothetical protein
MWMSMPTPVMTSVMTIDSWSSWKARRSEVADRHPREVASE